MKEWLSHSKQLRKCEVLGSFVKEVGPPTIQLETDSFRALVEAILSQQLAPKAAQSIITKVTCIAKPFPSARHFLALSPQQLRSYGVSPQKSRYILDLSEKWRNKTWKKGWVDLDDLQLIQRLTEVRGIGEWTAQMFLIFSLGKPDVLAVKDYGLQRGFKLLFGLRQLPKPEKMLALSQRWIGKRSVVSWYIWKSLDRGLLD